MNAAAANPEMSAVPDAGSARPGVDPRAELQARIHQMQSSRLDSRKIPTVPSLGRLLPGGGLSAGGAYSVRDSTTVAMALLAGPSVAGSWCGVIDLPSFSVEAAAGFGIELSRLILVPHPGDQWLAVTAAMVDVVSVILTKAPEQLKPTDAARLKARLRQRGATLITLGQWAHSDAALSVSESNWNGLGAGTGYLRSRRMQVTVHGSGRSRTADLELADLVPGPPGEESEEAPAFRPKLVN